MYEPLIARCHAATKNANAGILLYRIAFWMPKAKVSHRKLKWVANSAQQWCQETGLSHDQYRRAIALLRDLGLVESEQRKKHHACRPKLPKTARFFQELADKVRTAARAVWPRDIESHPPRWRQLG